MSEPLSRLRAPSIAVVIPAYNAEKTLERTRQSVVDSVDQARTAIPNLIGEIAVVDDASTDGTGVLIKHWATEHADIKHVSNKKQGPRLFP